MSVDAFLRKLGFAIHDRHVNAMPIWRDKRTGRLVPECDAWTLALGREKAAVEAERQRKG